MNKSETIEKLAQALSKLQGEVQNLFKDKTGHNYKYTDLASVLDMVRPLCAKYELSVSQLCCNDPASVDVMGVETVLMHSSGQYISSVLYMNVTIGRGMSAAQAAGSVITYARRYALAALLGIAQTDTDASVEHPAPKPSQSQYNAVTVSKSNNDTYNKLIDLIRFKAIPKEQLMPILESLGAKKISELGDKELAIMLEEVGAL